jgi:bacteriorhodopsin
MFFQQDEAAPDLSSVVVTFPDDYPNSVRHFLMIGFLGMLIGAGIFFYMGITRKVNTMTHVLVFFIAMLSACSYYAMWQGMGVLFKTIDTTPRVIFWAHYVDWVVTGPLIIACLAMLSKSDLVTLVFMMGVTIFMELCSLIGAMTVAPFKYMWWVAAVAFYIILVYLLIMRLNNAEGYGGQHLKTLTWLTIISWIVYPILWIVGSEGTAALGLSQQVGFITITDLVAKLGFCGYLIFNFDEPQGDEPINQSSQQYV